MLKRGENRRGYTYIPALDLQPRDQTLKETMSHANLGNDKGNGESKKNQWSGGGQAKRVNHQPLARRAVWPTPQSSGAVAYQVFVVHVTRAMAGMCSLLTQSVLKLVPLYHFRKVGGMIVPSWTNVVMSYT